MKRLLWAACALVLLVVAAGFAVPHFAADRFGAAAQKALENSLGRKVKIRGKVTYNLFTGPGFTITDLVIYDDPSLSAEPILYTAALTAVPRIWPLFTGRLAFSSIRLEDAHINLGRTASPEQPAHWNVAPLTRPALFQAFPNISVVSGGVTGIPKSRINFKIGGVKTPFYILIDRLEVHPPSTENGPWAIRLEGEPARTDRPALGFGSFVADGSWIPSQGIANINVKLERSEIGDIITLLNDHDAGVHGSVSGSARLAGPLSALNINGRLEASGIHGFDQMASSQRWPLEIAGTWNVPGQLFELAARLAGQPNSPVNAHFRVADYLGAPHWGFGLTCRALPLDPLVGLGRHLGLSIPQGVQLKGTLDGAVTVARTGFAEGSARITQAALTSPSAPPVTFEDAELVIAQGHARLASAAFYIADQEQGAIEGDYDLNSHALLLSVSTHGMDLDKARPYAATMGIPVFRDLAGGTWKGEFAYGFVPGSPAPEGRWTGNLDLQRTTLTLPAVALPVRVATAHIEMDRTTLSARKLQVKAGDVSATGEYRYLLGADRPNQFRLSTPHLTGAQVEGLFRPALYRGTLASRLGLRRADVPDWLAQVRADGTLEIGLLTLGGFDFAHVATRMLWDGPRVKFAGAKARYGNAAVNSAIIEADLNNNAPVYHGAGNVSGVSWKGGKVDADLNLDTAGAGLETLGNLRAEGSFTAHDMNAEYSSMQGCFLFNWSARSPQVKLTSLQVYDGDDVFVGRGATGADGALVLDLAGVEKPVRLSLR